MINRQCHSSDEGEAALRKPPHCKFSIHYTAVLLLCFIVLYSSTTIVLCIVPGYSYLILLGGLAALAWLPSMWPHTLGVR
jgi:hypothetical protein